MLNMDFLKEVLIDSKNLDWQASPMAGVWRKPLAREEAERGHATSIVKYEAGSFFRSHPHPGGEEIFVIRGTFSDESGDYHAGSYFRNPPGTSHAPHSKSGCELFVKLHQFDVNDREQVFIDTNTFLQSEINFHLLHVHEKESVYWIKLTQTSDLSSLYEKMEGNESIEILMLKGKLSYKHNMLNEESWFRCHDFKADLLNIEACAILLCKIGHF